MERCLPNRLKLGKKSCNVRKKNSNLFVQNSIVIRNTMTITGKTSTILPQAYTQTLNIHIIAVPRIKTATNTIHLEKVRMSEIKIEINTTAAGLKLRNRQENKKINLKIVMKLANLIILRKRKMNSLNFENSIQEKAVILDNGISTVIVEIDKLKKRKI